jgi:hypothetical protein
MQEVQMLHRSGMSKPIPGKYSFNTVHAKCFSKLNFSTLCKFKKIALILKLNVELVIVIKRKGAA